MYKETRMSEVKITDGLIHKKRNIVEEKTIPYIRKALNNELYGVEPSGAFENFRIAAGESDRNFYGLVSQDSDVFKWMEAASLSLQYENEEMQTYLEEAIDLLDRAQQKNGYLNTYYIIHGLQDRWHYLKESCQLYCAGHLIEAAVSAYQTIQNTKLLEIARAYADYIDYSFGIEEGKIHGYDGHAEIELALYRLYEETNVERYKLLADYFVEERGKKPYFFSKENRNQNVRNNLVYELEESNYQHSQSHLPIREQTEPVGHAVKAMYYYTAAVDKARLNEDKELFAHMCKLWQSVVSQKMYLTGAIGACAYGESFSYPYDLPTDLMYGETCAAIGLFLLSYHMLLVETDSRYSDIMERTLYNAILVGMSESGTEFFYTNALEIDPRKCEKRQDYSHLKAERQTWFDCPCCPPNIARLLMGMNKYIYTGDRNELNVHLFIGSSIQKAGWSVRQETVYPDNGNVKFYVKKDNSEKGTFRVRIPEWCSHYEVSLDGEKLKRIIRKGYLEIAKEYEAAGASAISCLTEPFYFMGSDTYLREITETVDIPVLRKDFTVDKYMIYQAKAMGASAVLLICSVLEDGRLKAYHQLADELGLSALVETHNEEEILRAQKIGAKIIGVNNRNLKDFTVDIKNSIRLREMVSSETVFVSESGIRGVKDMKALYENGTDAVLIGELLMKKSDRKAALMELKQQTGRQLDMN